MAQITLDECLNPALRTKIKKLVELNLDSDSIWDLLDPNLKSYEDYMYNEVEKYVKYVLWLRENNRSLDNAYEKYKNYTQNVTQNFKRDLANRLELEQKRKDQQRIDELSALMKFSRRQKHKPKPSNDLSLSEETAVPQANEVLAEKEVSPLSPVLEFAKNEESQPLNRRKSEVDEENTDEVNEGDSTESDLDFIDLATQQNNEASVTLNTKDLLFETMSNVARLENESTFESAAKMEAENEKTLTVQASTDGSKTNEALAFYNQLEDEYGKETVKGPTATYELGSKINYHNENYIIVKTEMVKDYFDKYEIIITLKNIATKATIRVNRKQIENEN